MLLTKTLDHQVIIPRMHDLSSFRKEMIRKQYLGRLDGCPCYSAELPEHLSAPEGMTFYDLRGLYGLVEDTWFALAGRAIQIMNWDRTHLYCGHCGAPVEKRTGEYVKVCPRCGQFYYPRISPAVIVAVVKEDQILLARSKQRSFKFYSVLAGFVEPGESLEECVKREVWEEVNVHVKNIRYFGSQPWPFPDSLMIAFTAEYHRGELQADGKEILEAGWFSARDLPPIPGKISISRSLIDWFRANHP
ncbi:NADH pyrophosphatase [Candidatus Formimonas warabiya]|uniref:NAD(+) diphosphatase n=2 Tax=Formimonas warabiya TaxID=1761012 RepID=A0A3G1L2B0_FORW1|nr:NADH pyrophosphatase [Candidatus Formimonas warabiya]